MPVLWWSAISMGFIAESMLKLTGFTFSLLKLFYLLIQKGFFSEYIIGMFIIYLKTLVLVSLYKSFF